MPVVQLCVDQLVVTVLQLLKTLLVHLKMI